MVDVLDTVLSDDPQALAKADPAPPCALVIFGAGGDLTKRLLMPALYNLACARLLPDEFALHGIDRAEGGDESFRKSQHETMESFVRDRGGEFSPQSLDEDRLGWLLQRMTYQSADFDNPDTFKAIGEWVGDRSAVSTSQWPTASSAR